MSPVAISSLFARLALVAALKGCGAELWQPFEDDEASAVKVLRTPHSGDLGHGLIGIVDALADLVARCKGERRG